MEVNDKNIKEYVRKKKRMTVPELQTDFGITYAEARRVISELAAKGAVKFVSGLEFEATPQFLQQIEEDMDDELQRARADLARRRAKLMARKDEMPSQDDNEEEENAEEDNDEEEGDDKNDGGWDDFWDFDDDDEDFDDEEDDEDDDDEVDDDVLAAVFDRVAKNRREGSDRLREFRENEKAKRIKEDLEFLARCGITPEEYIDALGLAVQCADDGRVFKVVTMQQAFRWPFAKAAHVYELIDRNDYFVPDPDHPTYQMVCIDRDDLEQLKRDYGVK